MRAGNRCQLTRLVLAHPRHAAAIVKPDYKIDFKLDTAFAPFDYSDDVTGAVARGHEIENRCFPRIDTEPGFKHQRIFNIGPLDFPHSTLR